MNRIRALTKRESQVLVMLAKSRGAITKGEALADALFGDSTPGAMSNVRQIVFRLRCKLAAASETGITIQTVQGTGYLMSAKPCEHCGGSGYTRRI